MPEYLSPGVYIEEIATGTHPIEGVPTSPQGNCLDRAPLERPSYFNGMVLNAEDLQKEQDYLREKLRRHNRLAHGWGVVCGLAVSADPSADQPWRVRIDAGVALAPSGDEVIVPTTVSVDLAKHRPGSAATVFIGVRYAEYPIQPAPGAEPTTTAPARCIQEGACIGCLAALPESHRLVEDESSLCDIIRRGRTVPCPPCDADPWVVLAQVQLPVRPRTPLSTANIDAHRVRRIAGATAQLQAQVITCCCNGQQQRGPASLTRWLRTLFGTVRPELPPPV